MYNEEGGDLVETLNKDQKKIERLSAFMSAITKDLSREEKRKVYEEYKDAVQDVRPIDLFYVEMYKEASAYSVETIKKTANKFVNVFREGLKDYELREHDHPFFKALLEENDAIIKHLETMKDYFKKGPITESIEALIKGFERCLELDRKFVKKENILFPAIEDKVPSTRPLEVMWSLHDDARKMTKDILAHLKSDHPDEKYLKETIGHYYYLVYGIVQKEQLILFPVADMVLGEKTLDILYRECFDYGFTFIDKTPPDFDEEETKTNQEEGVFKTKTGALDFKQVALVFNHLPVDITYVDKNDRVRYFNDRKERHFPRSPSIIGRLVKHCHPPKSVSMVETIVENFKSGQRNEAEFWINFKDRFLHIRYFAVRDANDNYEGVLEVSQDVTDIRGLKGEKRLLDWE